MSSISGAIGSAIDGIIGGGIGSPGGAIVGDYQFIVLDSDGNCFTVSNIVRAADGIQYAVSITVTDSDGNTSDELAAFDVLDSDNNRHTVPHYVRDSDGNEFLVIRQVTNSSNVDYTMACGSGTPAPDIDDLLLLEDSSGSLLLEGTSFSDNLLLESSG